jgi:hypothetical protein
LCAARCHPLRCIDRDLLHCLDPLQPDTIRVCSCICAALKSCLCGVNALDDLFAAIQEELQI